VPPYRHVVTKKSSSRMNVTQESDCTTEVRGIDVVRHLKISLNVISSQMINNYKMLKEGPVK
jgi:hypothetical protein